MTDSKKIIIVGGGFGGLTAAKAFASSDFEITIIDRTNHHLFQPLLYQVATAALSPGDIAIPIRTVFSGQKNIKILMDEVLSIDRKRKKVILSSSEIGYDFLILAPGSKHSYFGKDQWEKFAPGLKTLSDALKIRETLLYNFEEVEKIGDPKKAKKFLTSVIIGGGPTGVELAGAIAEISKETIMKDYRSFKPSDTKIILIEAASRLLGAFDEKLSAKTYQALTSLGVEVILNKKVVEVNSGRVILDDMEINAGVIIWAAGNKASPLLQSLNTELDSAGRAIVNPDLSIKEDKNIFVIGDAAYLKNPNGKILPAVAPVAIQQGKYVASVIKNYSIQMTAKPFKYIDKGSMATIGRAKAVAEIKNFKLSGFIAWAAWCFIHIFFLINFRNRLRVMSEWIWFYITRKNGIRLIVSKFKDENTGG